MRPDPHPQRPGALIVDVGSTATKLALADGDRLVRLGSFATGRRGTDGWHARFGAALAGTLAPGAVAYVALSSTAPGHAERLRRWWADRHGADVPVRAVEPATVPLAIDYRPPSSLGPDRLADAVAATARWGAPVIVVDVGTAITCDLVSAGRRFAGGAIAPGPHTAYRSLVDRVPHLALAGGLAADGELPLAATSTGDAVRVGVLRGAAALVDSLVAGYRSRVSSCPVIVTGGLAPLVARHCATVTAIDPDLTLRGIHLACAGVATGSSPPARSWRSS